MVTNPNLRTDHQTRIEEFMEKAGQKLPPNPTVPDLDTRILRAKLILEEAMETVEALGVGVGIKQSADILHYDNLNFFEGNDPDLVEIVDGCCDVSVVTMGTLSACGVGAKPFLEEVDSHNLAKFGPGGYRRDDGKWMKPKDLAPPQIQKLLDEQENPF